MLWLLSLLLAYISIADALPPQKKLEFPAAMVGTGRILCPGCAEDEVKLFYSKKEQKMSWSTKFMTQVVDKDGVYYWNATQKCEWDWWTFEHFMQDYSDLGFRYIGDWTWTSMNGVQVSNWLGAEYSRTIATVSLDNTGLLKALGTINEETLKRSGAQYELSWFDEMKTEEPVADSWKLLDNCAGKMQAKKEQMKKEMEKAQSEGVASRMAKAVAHQRNLHSTSTKTSIQQTQKPTIPAKDKAPKAPFDHHLQADVDQELFRGIVTYDMNAMTRRNDVLPTQKLQGKYLRDKDANILGFEISLNPAERVPTEELERDIFIINDNGAFMSRRGFCETNATLTWAETTRQMQNLDWFGEVKTSTGKDINIWVGEIYRRPMIAIFDKATNTEAMFYTAGYVKMDNGGIFRMVDEWTLSNQERSKPATNDLFKTPDYCSDAYKKECHEQDVVKCMERVIKKDLFTANECEVLFLAHQCHKNGICKGTQQKVCIHLKNSGCGDCETDWY